ncbi:MAG: hypothetical protein SOW78_00035, partial [Clostridia bacterium]|nr:hypothetical protein [Clostridia bacterium]
NENTDTSPSGTKKVNICCESMVRPFASMAPIRKRNVFKENPLYIFAELPISKYAETKNSAIPIHCP